MLSSHTTRRNVPVMTTYTFTKSSNARTGEISVLYTHIGVIARLVVNVSILCLKVDFILIIFRKWKIIELLAYRIEPLCSCNICRMRNHNNQHSNSQDIHKGFQWSNNTNLCGVCTCRCKCNPTCSSFVPLCIFNKCSLFIWTK